MRWTREGNKELLLTVPPPPRFCSSQNHSRLHVPLKQHSRTRTAFPSTHAGSTSQPLPPSRQRHCGSGLEAQKGVSFCKEPETMHLPSGAGTTGGVYCGEQAPAALTVKSAASRGTVSLAPSEGQTRCLHFCSLAAPCPAGCCTGGA